jgi:hypothetical protein
MATHPLLSKDMPGKDVETDKKTDAPMLPKPKFRLLPLAKATLNVMCWWVVMTIIAVLLTRLFVLWLHSNFGFEFLGCMIFSWLLAILCLFLPGFMMLYLAIMASTEPQPHGWKIMFGAVGFHSLLSVAVTLFLMAGTCHQQDPVLSKSEAYRYTNLYFSTLMGYNVTFIS